MPLPSNIAYTDSVVNTAGRGEIGIIVNQLKTRDINNVKASQIVMQMFGCFGNFYNKQTNKQTYYYIKPNSSLTGCEGVCGGFSRPCVMGREEPLPFVALKKITKSIK